MRKYFLIAVIGVVLCGICVAYAQQGEGLPELSKRLLEVRDCQDIFTILDQTEQIYSKDHKYEEFVVFVKSLAAKNNFIEPCVNYYIARARYAHLAYLEENQLWDEYFAQGSAYRDQIVEYAKRAIDVPCGCGQGSQGVRSRILLWQFHKSQQDQESDQALVDLLAASRQYAQVAKDPLPVKEAADAVAARQERIKAVELYKIYVSMLLGSAVSDDELKNTADRFYSEGNLELAEAVYDAYIERMTRISSKEQLVVILMETGSRFIYNASGRFDALYAEKIYTKLEELAGKNALDEEIIYLRAFGLEKIKEFEKTKILYAYLLQTFPATMHRDQILLKLGIITVYALRDVAAGKTYFEQLAQGAAGNNPYVLSSLYHLGLLNQYQNNPVEAKKYFDMLVSAAGSGFSDVVGMAKNRLSEIADARTMEYNLRVFLDTCFKLEYAQIASGKSNLSATNYLPGQNQDITISSGAQMPSTGCFSVDMQYLWSGNTGDVKPISAMGSMITSYPSAGTKEIFLVVVTSSGVTERGIDMVDVK